jgi:glucose/arabinose dehydrogenase
MNFSSASFSLLLCTVFFWIFAVSPSTAQTPEIFNAYPNISFNSITDIQSDGTTSRVFVAEKDGRIRVFQDELSIGQTTTFLDLSGIVTTDGEGGLVGLAFHPDYASNGRFFIYYTTTDNGDFVSRLSEFTVSDDPDVADSDSEIIRLQLVQPGIHHNSGQLQFGPDGYLYVAFGDGIASFENAAGGVADPFNHGQNPTTLFSSMVRMDIDGGGNPPDCGGAGVNESANYGIPADNPFVGDNSACDEIFAYGFRNPFRFSFDDTGRLWAGDVGEDHREEINWVEAGTNYGWKVVEGTRCFPDGGTCDQSGLEAPVFEYSHDNGRRSVTGGYVVPPGGCSFIEGDYIFGDFLSGQIWRLQPEDAPFQTSELLIDTDLSVVTFGIATNGQLLIGDYDGQGSLYKFDCATLPVELVDFKGRLDDERIVLSWTTASETENAGFIVQHRGPTSFQFQAIGFVEGNGTTREPTTYRFGATVSLDPGIHTFRLRQVDTDGTATVSDAVRVRIPVTSPLQLSSLQPNPIRTQGQMTVSVAESQHVQIALFDVLGRKVASVFDGRVESTQPERITLSTGSLAAGVYLLRAKSQGGTVTQRIVVTR